MSRQLSISIFALLLAVLAYWPIPAAALTNCSVSSTPLAFGATSGGANVDTAANLVVTCTTSAVSLLSTVRIRMCLNIGSGSAAGQYTPRRMLNTFNDPLSFQIYRDAARSTQIWGSNSIPAIPTPLQVDLQYSVLILGGGGSTPQLTMYGRIPPQSPLAEGSYTNVFNDANTRLDFRYNEQLIGTPPYPGSCTSGGIGGGTVPYSFTASANVPRSCSITAASDLDFGAISGLITANGDQTSTISMTCTGRTAWNVGLNNGLNSSGIVRRMRLGATTNYVNYELYRETGRTNRWGNTTGTDTLPGTGTGAAQSLTVFGRVPATQAAAAGSYSDTITVTITY